MKEEKMARCGCTTNGGENLLTSPRDMLKFGKKVLEEDQYDLLHHSYRQQYRIQMGFVGAMVILVTAAALLTAVWEKAWVAGIIAVILLSFVWGIVSPFLTGKLWRQYVRW